MYQNPLSKDLVHIHFPSNFLYYLLSRYYSHNYILLLSTVYDHIYSVRWKVNCLKTNVCISKVTPNVQIILAQLILGTTGWTPIFGSQHELTVSKMGIYALNWHDSLNSFCKKYADMVIVVEHSSPWFRCWIIWNKLGISFQSAFGHWRRFFRVILVICSLNPRYSLIYFNPLGIYSLIQLTYWLITLIFHFANQHTPTFALHVFISTNFISDGEDLLCSFFIEYM